MSEKGISFEETHGRQVTATGVSHRRQPHVTELCDNNRLQQQQTKLRHELTVVAGADVVAVDVVQLPGVDGVALVAQQAAVSSLNIRVKKSRNKILK